MSVCFLSCLSVFPNLRLNCAIQQHILFKFEAFELNIFMKVHFFRVIDCQWRGPSLTIMQPLKIEEFLGVL